MDYRFDGKRKTLFFKSYPEKSLVDARKDRDEARQRLSNSFDPGALKKERKVREQVQAEIDANTFEKVAREWHQHNTTVFPDSVTKGRLVGNSLTPSIYQ